MSGFERVHLVWSHPRTDSLTAFVVSRIRDQVQLSGTALDELDLYRSHFDPVLHEADEPDWNNLDKTYSPETESLIERVQEADLVVVVFPVWWYGLPAMLKGYIDRVWNHGRLYGGGRRANAEAVLWVGLVGVSQDEFETRGHRGALERQLTDGIAHYCGVPDSRVVLIYDTLDSPDVDHVAQTVADAMGAWVGRKALVPDELPHTRGDL